MRPLHSIVATFGPETEKPEIVPFKLDGIAASDTTAGHRFMAPAPIKVRHFDDYVKKLDAAKVVLDPARRAEMIRAKARRTSPSRKATSWSKTKGCWPKPPVWSNGRWC